MQPNSLSVSALSDFIEDLKDQLFKNPDMTAEEIIECLNDRRFYAGGDLPEKTFGEHCVIRLSALLEEQIKAVKTAVKDIENLEC